MRYQAHCEPVDCGRPSDCGSTSGGRSERLEAVTHLSALMPRALARYLPHCVGAQADNLTPSIKEDDMLLLSRKPAETIVINDSVVVKVVKISGGRVAIGIQAPQGISIRRGELPTAPTAAASGPLPGSLVGSAVEWSAASADNLAHCGDR